jgi:hypothetical protein
MIPVFGRIAAITVIVTRIVLEVSACCTTPSLLAARIALIYSQDTLNGVPSSSAIAERARPNPLNLNGLVPA